MPKRANFKFNLYVTRKVPVTQTQPGPVTQMTMPYGDRVTPPGPGLRDNRDTATATGTYRQASSHCQ